MKRLILYSFICSLLFSSVSMAQVLKGTKYLGAGFNLSGYNRSVKSEDDLDYKDGQTSLSPSLHYGGFYKDNRILGVSLSASIRREYLTDSQMFDNLKLAQVVSSVSVAPFLRQYKSLGERWHLFVQESVPLTFTFYKSSIGGDGAGKDNGFAGGLSVVPGISYRVSKRFVIESSINLMSLGVIYSSQPDAKYFSFESSVTTGIQNYFGIRAVWLFVPSEK